MNKFLERFIEAGFLFIIAFSPLAFGSVHVWAYSLIEIISFVLLAAWAAKSFLYGFDGYDRKLLPVYISVLLFLGYTLFQLIPLPPEAVRFLSPKAYSVYGTTIQGYPDGGQWRGLSVYAHATKQNFIEYCSYAAIFFLLTVEYRERRKIERLVIAMVLTGFFEALYGLYGYFTKDQYIFGFKRMYYLGSAVGTFVNKNHFAGYLGITAFMGVGYLLSRFHSGSGEGIKQRIIGAFSTSRAPERGLLSIAVITMALGIVFSLSRMGVFSFITAFLAILLIAILSRHGKTAKVLAAVFFCVVMVSLFYGIRPLEERYMQSAEAFITERYQLWLSTVGIIKDFPLTGSGQGTFESVLPAYQSKELAGSLMVFTHAHNDYLELLSDGGLLGAVPVAFGGAYFIVLLFRKRAGRRNFFSRGVSLGCLGAIFYILFHSAMDFNMRIPANALSFFAASGIAYASLVIRRGR